MRCTIYCETYVVKKKKITTTYTIIGQQRALETVNYIVYNIAGAVAEPLRFYYEKMLTATVIINVGFN